MTQNVISIGSYASFLIDAKDITPLMQIIERMTPVDRRWMDDGAVWVLTKDREVEIKRDSRPVISLAEYDERREAEVAAREAKEREKEDAADAEA